MSEGGKSTESLHLAASEPPADHQEAASSLTSPVI